jgi:uncharacterized protein (TIGR02001 family)
MNALNWITNRHVISALCAAPLLLSSAFASAEDAAPAATVAAAPSEPASPHTLTFNLGLYSAYMFRGVALSDGPAIQGGVDYGHSSGFYAGTWWSNIDKDFTGHGDGFSGGNSLETDWYAGYAHTFENGIGVNVLGNYYYYPNRENSFSAGDVGDKQDSFEASIALSYKWFTYTYYNVLTDYYGAAKDGTNDGTSDTSNATYNELKFNYTLPVADLNFLAKVGYQHTPNLTGSQGDLAIGLSRNFSLPSAGKPIEGFSAGAYYTDTFHVKNEAFYVTSDGRDTNREKLWFFVKRTW